MKRTFVTFATDLMIPRYFLKREILPRAIIRTTVYFDLGTDGLAEAVNWPTTDDGSEVFGNAAVNGFAASAANDNEGFVEHFTARLMNIKRVAAEEKKYEEKNIGFCSTGQGWLA